MCNPRASRAIAGSYMSDKFELADRYSASFTKTLTLEGVFATSMYSPLKATVRTPAWRRLFLAISHVPGSLNSSSVVDSRVSMLLCSTVRMSVTTLADTGLVSSRVRTGCTRNLR